ncbi:MAG: ATP--guanido phosphotransferase, partial [Verrucomicrobiota bacterium]
KARTVANEIGRAYGILRNSYSISSKEVLNLLSMLRLGTDLGMLPEEHRGTIDELFMRTQPAHLQQQLDSKLTGEERDALRADVMRDKLKDWPPPSTQDLDVITPGQDKQEKQAKKKDPQTDE